MLLKDYYDMAYVEQLARQVQDACPEFDSHQFVAGLRNELADQSYSQKMAIIATALHRHLPGYRQAIAAFRSMLGPEMTSMSEMYDAGMPYAPMGKFVELFAAQHEDCFDLTTGYVSELTKRYTGEFAMRPLLAAMPERSIAVLWRWTADESACVRRLASECMRIAIPWGSKLRFALDYFDDYSAILLRLAADENEYVRRSVANNINELCKADIGKARQLVAQLDTSSKDTKKLITHATRWARKKGVW